MSGGMFGKTQMDERPLLVVPSLSEFAARLFVAPHVCFWCIL